MSAGNTHVLPDSRLGHRPDFGCFMADWPLPDGRTVRVEVQPIFCANCGKLCGHCPRENTTFLFYQCPKCFGQFGALAGTMAVPDDEFNRAVSAELTARFGRTLTEFEIAAAKDRGVLGRALELLERESPYPVPNPARSG